MYDIHVRTCYYTVKIMSFMAWSYSITNPNYPIQMVLKNNSKQM